MQEVDKVMNDLLIRGADGKLYNANGELVSSEAVDMLSQTDFTSTENSFAASWFAESWFASSWFASSWFASTDFASENM